MPVRPLYFSLIDSCVENVLIRMEGKIFYAH